MRLPYAQLINVTFLNAFAPECDFSLILPSILKNRLALMAKKKYYVVWDGKTPGIYDNWDACKREIQNFENAKYKSFEDKESAEKAYNSNCWLYIGKKKLETLNTPRDIGLPIMESISVDAACSGNPGLMEYRGVATATSEVIFKQGPFQLGTNNIGEFLALVHALALLKQKKIKVPIYSDSETAMAWVRNKKHKSKLLPNEKNKNIFDLLERAEIWLKNNTIENDILKWETKYWGEIPADFGRK